MTASGTLYIVPTPIGNLEDITLRALRMLREVRLVLAEDTRTTGNLLRHYGIATPLLSYTEQKHDSRLERIRLELGLGDVALVSDAGMPAISDPGQALVSTLTRDGVRVTGLPGPSAVPLGVALAGFPVNTFTFVGFLPRTSTARRRLFEQHLTGEAALVAFESPHRLRAALADIGATLGERRLAVCRELTKLHEEVFRGTASAALERFAEVRGEVVLVIEGAPDSDSSNLDVDQLRRFLQTSFQAGGTARDAVAAAALHFGVNRRTAYREWEQLKR